MSAPVRNRMIWTGAVAAILVVLGLVAWAIGVPGLPGRPDAGPIVLADDLGRKVTLPRRPRTIVSVAPSNTEILYALDLGDRVVGVTDECDYPEEAKSKPKVGAIELNYERIVEISPDLVLAVGSLQRQAVDKLSGLGLTVLAVDPRTLDGVLRAITLAGEATGAEDRASALVAELSRRIEAVKSRVSRVPPSARPRVFVEIWNDPLMTAGPGTFIDELVAVAGGENIAHDAGGEWPQFSVEQVIERDPEVVILTGFNKAEVLARPAWQGISAFEAGRVHEVDPDLLSRPGPRLVDGLEELARLLHPEVFE